MYWGKEMIITILRKPLDGSVADNSLKHGCGALNIDATRVKHNEDIKVIKAQETGNLVFGQSGRYEDTTELKPEGRWPANFILNHKKGCEIKGTKKVKSNGHWTQKANIGKFYEGGWSHQEIDEGNKLSDDENNEKVADWDCEEGCPVKILDEQSGVSKSTGGRIGNKGGAYSHLGETGFKNNAVKGDPGFGDSGGASRFFKQFKKENDQ